MIVTYDQPSDDEIRARAEALVDQAGWQQRLAGRPPLTAAARGPLVAEAMALEIEAAREAVQFIRECPGCAVLTMPGADGRCLNCGEPIA